MRLYPSMERVIIPELHKPPCGLGPISALVGVLRRLNRFFSPEGDLCCPVLPTFKHIHQVDRQTLDSCPSGGEFARRIFEWACKLESCHNHEHCSVSMAKAYNDFILFTGTRSPVRLSKSQPWTLRDTSYTADAQLVPLGKEVNTFVAAIRWAHKKLNMCPLPDLPKPQASCLTLIGCSKYAPAIPWRPRLTCGLQAATLLQKHFSLFQRAQLATVQSMFSHARSAKSQKWRCSSEKR